MVRHCIYTFTLYIARFIIAVILLQFSPASMFQCKCVWGETRYIDPSDRGRISFEARDRLCGYGAARDEASRQLSHLRIVGPRGQLEDPVNAIYGFVCDWSRWRSRCAAVLRTSYVSVATP
jgi:hypothetical protein